MKSAEQLIAEWKVTPENVHKVSMELLVSYVKAAMQVGVLNTREELFLVLNDGVYCPICDQLCKAHPRTMNANMAIFMVSLVQAFDRTGDWVHYKDCEYSGRDYPFVKDFGLAVMASPEDKTPDQGRVSGFWKPTELGRDFVHKAVSVPKRIFVYNNKVVCVSPDSSNIIVALGSKFDYRELMKIGTTTESLRKKT